MIAYKFLLFSIASFIFLTVIPRTQLCAQAYSIQLKVVDQAEIGIPNATIKISGQLFATDSIGIVSIKLRPGNHVFNISAIGYAATTYRHLANKDQSLTITLTSASTMLSGVEITAGRNQHVNRNQMGTHRLEMSQIQKLPVILGEVDPIKIITLLPGIKNSGEGGAGLYVRGGGPDQNLVLLDGIQVYNPNHLLGFFSVFNGDAISNVEVIKGGMPSEYGGRLSSVVAINTKEGNVDSLKFAGGIGLLSTRLSAEGPLIKGKSSFSVSARRTYIDQVAKLISDTIGNNGYHFYDINAKLGYLINTKNSLHFTFYTGTDEFTYIDESDENQSRNFNANWGNTIMGLGWKQRLNDQFKHELLLVRSQFALNTGIAFGPFGMVFSSGLTDYQIKDDWSYLTNKVRLKAGLQYTFHRFRPGAGSSNSGVQEFAREIYDQHAREAAAYISADIDLTHNLNIIAGLRYSYFNQVGPTQRAVYAANGAATGETQYYAAGESIARYFNPEPRINLRYKLSNGASLKLSYTRTAQYLHLATTSAATFPSDLWVPSSQRIKPGLADQFAAGYFTTFGKGIFELGIETYYKTMNNQLEFRPGAQLLLNQNIEGEMTFGKGKAYGMELFIQKKVGRWNGWFGYTLSRAERTFSEMNNGQPFTYRYDRTHDFSLVASYRINKQWEASGVVVYGTGNALTLPNGRFVYDLGYNFTENKPVLTSINQYGAINDYRMPAYHRMDLSFTYNPSANLKRRYKSSWVFSLYNVYNRQNPYFIYLDVDEDDQRIQGKQVTLFPIVPGVTWNFKF